MIQLSDLKQGHVVQDGRTVLQISNVYENYCTAKILLTGKGQPPKRTAVRYYEAHDVTQRLTWCSDRMYDKAMEVY